MKQTKIKILLVIDENITNLEKVRKSFDMMFEDYKQGTDGLVGIEAKESRHDFDGVPFELYWGENWGLHRGWINQETKDFQKTHPYFDCVMFVIDNENWTKEGNQRIYGWNMARFYNGYQVQQVRFNNAKSDIFLYRTMLMELTHSLDNFIKKELGKDLNKIFGVKDFDKDIVHNKEMFYAGYRDQLKVIKNELFQVFAKRETMIALIKIFQGLVKLYRALIFRLKAKKEEPIIF